VRRRTITVTIEASRGADLARMSARLQEAIEGAFDDEHAEGHYGPIGLGVLVSPDAPSRRPGLVAP
jgi:predicted RNase H-like HicB family nuclease